MLMSKQAFATTSDDQSTPLALSLGACLVILLAAPNANAQSVYGPQERSETIQSWILDPLYSEFAPSNQTWPDQTNDRYSDHLRFTPAEPVTDTDHSARPAAARFAGAALGALSDTVSRDELAAFNTQETTLAFAPVGGRLSVSIFDGQTPPMAMLAFNLDYAEAGQRALMGEEERAQRMALRYENTFDAASISGLDIGLAPRAGLAFGQAGAAAEAGLTARLGQYLNPNDEQPSWWLFAGADQQAVLYDPGQGFDVRDALVMQPYAIVGDAQAGLAMRVKGADFSFAYVHRETKYTMPHRSWDANEGFAAFSLTWRH